MADILPQFKISSKYNTKFCLQNQYIIQKLNISSLLQSIKPVEICFYLLYNYLNMCYYMNLSGFYY